MIARTTAGFVLATTLLVTACGGDDDATDTTSATSAPTTAAADDTTDDTTDNTTDDGDATTDTTEPATDQPDESQPPATTEPPATTAPPTGDRLLQALDIPAIEVLTPAAGGGERPLLEWVAVDGAASYHVVVQSDGEPYWAWVGATTSVPLGGGEVGSDPGLLAVLTPDAAFTFTVTAWGADDELLGASPASPLAP
jgi:hypothetical protein